MKRYTIKNFETQFPDDNACLEFIKNARWPKGIHCSKCGKVTKHHRITAKKVYSCDRCGVQVSPTANTIFHKSATSLKSWFHAIFLVASTRCGISAKQLERELGVTYKTAWRMFTHIRKLMAEDIDPLIGEVEVDETYIGGVRNGKRGRGAEGKTPVVGAVQRKGKAVAKVVSDTKRSTVLPFTIQKVSHKAILYTDEFPTYNSFSRFYNHKRIEHAAKVYVRGDVHTNSIEGFWSLVKRGISGVYHAVSPKYLQSYLDEYSFRYNRRNNETPMFTSLLNRAPSLVEQPS